MIEIKRLDSGFWHVKGTGHNDWAQPPQWPCSEETFLESCAQEASRGFKEQCLALLHTFTECPHCGRVYEKPVSECPSDDCPSHD